jgi:hypothetical protein
MADRAGPARRRRAGAAPSAPPIHGWSSSAWCSWASRQGRRSPLPNRRSRHPACRAVAAGVTPAPFAPPPVRIIPNAGGPVARVTA